jgi:hypothetical protein
MSWIELLMLSGPALTPSIAVAPHAFDFLLELLLCVVLPHFYSVRSKIVKITRIFVKVELFKNRGVTYWAEKNGPAVIRIISG